MQKGEKIFIVAIILFAGLMYWEATRVATPFGAGYTMGPTVWPKIMLMGAIILSLFLLIKNWKKKAESVLEEGEEFEKPNRVRSTGILIVCFIYAFAMSHLGFLISTPLFVAAILLLSEYRSIKKLFLIPITITAVFFLIFVWLASVPMPRGHWIFRNFSLLFY